MEQKAVLIGATGLIGSHFLNGLKDDDDVQIHAITRRKIDYLEQKSFIGQSVYDFKDLEAIRPALKQTFSSAPSERRSGMRGHRMSL